MSIVEQVNEITNQFDQGHAFWQNARVLLKHHLTYDCIDDFMQWPIIQETMFVGSPEYAETELNELMRDEQFNERWSTALEDNTVPPHLRYDGFPYSCGNTIHHVYHIYRWEKFCNAHIEDMKFILEIGAGYGNTARIIKQMGFTGTYIIIDLPEFVLLQQHYLQQANVNATKFMWNPQILLGGFDLVIAEWSLSEMPEAERTPLLNAYATYYLIAYSNEFAELKNSEYFASFRLCNSHVEWYHKPIDHLPVHNYMFGKP
jgi:hypothetical protein